MDDKTKLEMFEKLEKEREKSDSLYAPMIVKIIVFGLCTILLTGMVGALVKLVIIK